MEEDSNHSDPRSTKTKHTDRSRRDFLATMTAISAAAWGVGLPAEASTAGQQAAAAPNTASAAAVQKRFSGQGRFIAIQIGARSFVDEGVEKVLDDLQQKSGVNVLMPAVFTYGRGLAGRQVPGNPLPDHGVQEYDEVHGGSYARLHEEFAAGSVIPNVRAPELGEFDILGDVIPHAKQRGMQTYALFEEAYNPRLMPNFEKIAEVDMNGRVGGSTCFNNPDARNFLAALVKDWVTHNDIDGLMWESERQGPLNNAIGAHFGRFNGSASINCFCAYCVTKARAQGIDIDRVREGYAALQTWVKQTLQEPAVTHGAFAGFWRVMMEYPEIAVWEKFWFRSQEEVYALLYQTAKQIRPRAQVGWHIMHYVTMSPFFRAEQNYARLAKSADFIKPCPYNNCAGPRLAQFIRNVQSAVFRDSTPEDVLQLHYRMLGYENEPTLERLPTAGLSARYVAAETRRALAEVQGAVPIYPGIDIDIPTAVTEKRTQPSDVRDAVMAAFQAGAPGVVLSRKYAEMKLTNVAGAGEALHKLHLSPIV